jgi:hypothetical protein
MKRAALAVLAALFVAGCTSTVVLGSLSVDGGPPGVDLAHPLFDFSDGGLDFGPDGFDGFDGSTVGGVDLAH